MKYFFLILFFIFIGCIETERENDENTLPNLVTSPDDTSRSVVEDTTDSYDEDTDEDIEDTEIPEEEIINDNADVDTTSDVFVAGSQINIMFPTNTAAWFVDSCDHLLSSGHKACNYKVEKNRIFIYDATVNDGIYLIIKSSDNAFFLYKENGNFFTRQNICGEFGTINGSSAYWFFNQYWEDTASNRIWLKIDLTNIQTYEKCPNDVFNNVISITPDNNVPTPTNIPVNPTPTPTVNITPNLNPTPTQTAIPTETPEITNTPVNPTPTPSPTPIGVQINIFTNSAGMSGSYTFENVIKTFSENSTGNYVIKHGQEGLYSFTSGARICLMYQGNDGAYKMPTSNKFRIVNHVVVDENYNELQVCPVIDDMAPNNYLQKLPVSAGLLSSYSMKLEFDKAIKQFACHIKTVDNTITRCENVVINNLDGFNATITGLNLNESIFFNGYSSDGGLITDSISHLINIQYNNQVYHFQTYPLNYNMVEIKVTNDNTLILQTSLDTTLDRIEYAEEEMQSITLEENWDAEEVNNELMSIQNLKIVTTPEECFESGDNKLYRDWFAWNLKVRLLPNGNYQFIKALPLPTYLIKTAIEMNPLFINYNNSTDPSIFSGSEMYICLYGRDIGSGMFNALENKAMNYDSIYGNYKIKNKILVKYAEDINDPSSFSDCTSTYVELEYSDVWGKVAGLVHWNSNLPKCSAHYGHTYIIFNNAWKYWINVGGTNSLLGLPTQDTTTSSINGGLRYTTYFENGIIQYDEKEFKLDKLYVECSGIILENASSLFTGADNKLSDIISFSVENLIISKNGFDSLNNTNASKIAKTFALGEIVLAFYGDKIFGKVLGVGANKVVKPLYRLLTREYAILIRDFIERVASLELKNTLSKMFYGLDGKSGIIGRKFRDLVPLRVLFSSVIDWSYKLYDDSFKYIKTTINDSMFLSIVASQAKFHIADERYFDETEFLLRKISDEISVASSGGLSPEVTVELIAEVELALYDIYSHLAGIYLIDSIRATSSFSQDTMTQWVKVLFPDIKPIIFNAKKGFFNMKTKTLSLTTNLRTNVEECAHVIGFYFDKKYNNNTSNIFKNFYTQIRIAEHIEEDKFFNTYVGVENIEMLRDSFIHLKHFLLFKYIVDSPKNNLDSGLWFVKDFVDFILGIGDSTFIMEQVNDAIMAMKIIIGYEDEMINRSIEFKLPNKTVDPVFRFGAQ